ncbi:MAG TPA: hypothetical protein DIU15_13485 [Deltaproteobacteria bacterium]|nr:hypothetical protein [Deltaproteobacteria bacterium]HCP47052.1 hypothetical protein [Deltaproteobacteria bacterium]
MVDAALFTPELRAELAALEQPHPSFLVSLLTREEPAIQAFRDQINTWWEHVPSLARTGLASRLTHLENEVFFQAFAELAVHEIMRYHDIGVVEHAEEAGGWMKVASSDGGHEFGLGVVAYLPEVQMRGSNTVFRHLIRELNRIHHHYLFSVYLKKWLPYDFDPRPIKRALQVWLDSLDDGSWHGKYAEYRDQNIHLEFSILDKLNQDATSLVRFRISPLQTPDVLGKVRDCIESLLERAEKDAPPDLPLVATVFCNETWSLPDTFLQDYLYGKPDYSFNWTTHGGRVEQLKSYQQDTSKYGVFSEERLSRLSAVVLADKEWARDKVVFTLRVLHNPWAERPLPRDCLGEFAQFCTIGTEGDTAHLAWDNIKRIRFRLP